MTITELTAAGAQLKAAMVRHRETSRTGGYPSDLRDQAIVYSRDRLNHGGKFEDIARELGVSTTTVRDWAGREAGNGVTLVPVVVADSPPEGGGQLEVTFPSGIIVRTRGLSGVEFTALIETLARSQS